MRLNKWSALFIEDNYLTKKTKLIKMAKRIFKLKAAAAIFSCFTSVVMFVSCGQGSNTNSNSATQTIITESKPVSSTETQNTNSCQVSQGC